MNERFSAVTPDGIRLPIESGVPANKDNRETEIRPTAAAADSEHAVLFRKITNLHSSSKAACARC